MFFFSNNTDRCAVMWGKVCSVALEQWSIDFEGNPKSQEPLLWGCDPLSPFPDLYPVCSHQAAFVCMFSPATTTHLLAGTLADPVQILSLSVCVPAKYFISVCIVGCCRLENKRHARGTHMHPSWMHTQTQAACPTWLAAKLRECVLTPTLTGTSSSNSCFHVTHPPTDTRKLTNWPRGFLILKQSEMGELTIKDIGCIEQLDQ